MDTQGSISTTPLRILVMKPTDMKTALPTYLMIYSKYIISVITTMLMLSDDIIDR